MFLRGCPAGSPIPVLLLREGGFMANSLKTGVVDRCAETGPPLPLAGVCAMNDYAHLAGKGLDR